MLDETCRVGSTLKSLLREDGSYEEAKNQAIKSVLVERIVATAEARCVGGWGSDRRGS